MAASIAPGTRLGRYEILALVDTGGMGEVYRAHDTDLGRPVAVKILPPAFAGHADRLRRFELEARAAAALNHPNILAVHDVGQHGGTPYIVSELLEGRTLRACLDGAPLPLRKALEFGIQIAEGLAAAHDKGIVHRDLKPENIFVTPDERLKILDFGLAKLVEADSATLTAAPQTSVGAVLGTVGYLSPEQASGVPADQRSDIFSVGAVLFEMVTHRRAFSRATAAQTLAAVLEDDPMASVADSSETDPRVMNLVRRCLEKSAERRFQSARDLAFVLANELATTTLSQSPLTRLGRAQRPMLAVGAACVLLAISAGGMFRAFSTEQAATIGSAPARFAITLPANVPFSYGSPVAISPDGTHVAFAMTSGDGHQLFLRRLDRDELVPLRGTGGGEFPFFSADGEWVGFWSENKIRRVSIRGGTAITVADSKDSPFRGADWGDDGILFAPEALGPLSHVAVDSGEMRAATTLDAGRKEYSHRWPQILPGGRAWLYTALSGAPPAVGVSTAMLHIPARAETRELVPGASYARYVGDGVMLFVRDSQPFVVRFDPDRLELGSRAEPLGEPIVTRAGSGATFLSISSNGSAVFIKGGPASGRTLLWVDRSGVAQPIGALPASYSAPRISPDGSRVAVTITGDLGAGDVWIFDLNSGVRTRLTTDGRSSPNLAWSPDGAQVLFSSQRDGPANLYVQAASGGSTAERVVPNINSQFAGSWLRDGTITYAQGDAKTGPDVWAVRPSGRSPWPLVVLPATQFGGRVSPDGRWLAYTSNESGTTEAWVTTFSQPGPRWQVSAGGGQELVWSANSRELYFRRDTRMMAVPIDPAATQPVNRASTLFEGRYLYEPNLPGLPNYDVGPDGRFLMISSEAGRADEVQIVLNWTKYLAGRLATSR